MTEDRQKLATLVHHWIEHNSGHRESYLEWRDKVSGQDLPQTLTALDKVAELTQEMNRELQKAAQELSGGEGGSYHAEPTSAGEHHHHH